MLVRPCLATKRFGGKTLFDINFIWPKIVANLTFILYGQIRFGAHIDAERNAFKAHDVFAKDEANFKPTHK